MVVDSKRNGFYSEVISNKLFESVAEFDQKLVENIFKKEIWTGVKGLQFVVQEFKAKKEVDVSSYLIPLKKFTGTKEELDKCVEDLLIELIVQEEPSDEDTEILKAILMACSIELS